MAAAGNLSLLSVWPLVHLAACCSREAYDGCASTPAPRQGSDAVLERVRISHHSINSCGRIIVVAVSGSRKLVDWIVNINGWATEPEGVLSTQSNLCHTGYLQLVRQLLKPLATLLSGLEKDSTVLLTGHSSGAAIASLLYSHIKTAEYTASAEVGRGFRTIHCVVFGAPPISICPLQEPQPKGNGQHSLFLSLLNEDDLIIHADVGVILARCAGSMLAWTSVRCRKLSSFTLAAAQHRQAFVLSGTVLLISAAPDGVLHIHAQQCSYARLHKSGSSTWGAHRLVVYQERIASLYASMQRGTGPTACAFNEPVDAVVKQACSRDTLPGAQTCWSALSCAWVFLLVAVCMCLAFFVFARPSTQVE